MSSELAAVHTPGPWTPRPDCTNGDSIQVRADRLMVVAEVWPMSEPLAADDPVSQANARLIAAAPAMLEALKVVEWGGAAEIEPGRYVPACPSCGVPQQDGGDHLDGCELAEVIELATPAGAPSP